MHHDQIPNTLPSVNKLLTRITSAEKSQQKEIRMTIQEARELTVELALLTSSLGKTIQDIYQTMQKINNDTNKVEVKLEGGGF